MAARKKKKSRKKSRRKVTARRKKKTRSKKKTARKKPVGRKKPAARKKPARRKKKTKKKKRWPSERDSDKILAERLCYVRERHGLTRVFVTAETGINYESLSGYEVGQEHPPFWRIRLLAIYYGVSLDYLAGRTSRLVIKKANARSGRR